MRARSFLFILLVTWAAPLTAQAIGPVWPITDMPRFWLLPENSAQISVDGTYFYSTANYSAFTGIPSTPSTMLNLVEGEMRIHGAFGLAPNISVFAQTSIRSVYGKNAPSSNIADDNNLGFADTFVALRYLLYRSRTADHVYPTEWTPNSWMAIAEASWVFPLYDTADNGHPPLGDQSNDFTGMIRLAWYANDWLALSGGLGVTYRTSGYAPAVPWQLRADFLFWQKSSWRFWVQADSNESLKNSSANAAGLNPSAADPIPGGSLLFKSESPIQRNGTLGVGYMVSKEWEVAVAGTATASGVTSAKGESLSLGLAWRPYQMPELRYDDYRKAQIAKLQEEPTHYRARKVVHYGMTATVLRVSAQGNFLRIGYGRRTGVKVGDLFQVFPPDAMDGQERKPLALARAYTTRLDDSFLRVEQRYNEGPAIKPGWEARRVIIEE